MMFQKVLHKNGESYSSREATHAQCLALLVEFVKAVRTPAPVSCAKRRFPETGSKDHGPGCAIRRADAFIGEAGA